MPVGHMRPAYGLWELGKSNPSYLPTSLRLHQRVAWLSNHKAIDLISGVAGMRLRQQFPGRWRVHGGAILTLVSLRINPGMVYFQIRICVRTWTMKTPEPAQLQKPSLSAATNSCRDDLEWPCSGLHHETF